MALPINSHDQTGFGVTERMLLATPTANLSVPALAPPRGVIPNFENPPNGNTTASVAFIVMMVVSTLCLVVRAYGKLYPRRMVYFEDGNSVTSFFMILPRSNQPRTDRFSRSSSCLMCLRTSHTHTVTDFLKPSEDEANSSKGNYWGCAWASYSLIRAPGFFVHNWDLLLGDTIEPYYVRTPFSHFKRPYHLPTSLSPR